MKPADPTNPHPIGSAAGANRVMDLLLPGPKKFRLDGSICPSCSIWDVQAKVDDQRIHRAAKAIAATLQSPGHRNHASKHRSTCLMAAVETNSIAHPQGYTLTIAPDQVNIIGGSTAGCFYGLQTLRQIAELGGGEHPLPCCTIEDFPDFETRGLLHDVTRGKVPTLDTLKHIVDRLAAWKCNQLQLYIEHAFVFTFDPDICDESNGLTPDEVRELDAYCRERFIQLVPAVATLGHMGRVLSLPRYRHLAEIEASLSWERMSWPQRARGLTLDCMNPESHRLVERIWGDIFDAFSSPVVNICGDEPWDLGQGKNRERLADNQGEAYLEHIRRTHDFCFSNRRSTQFWSDVLRNHPALFPKVPRNATVLHWGYDETADYEATGLLTDAGMTVYVCPGTRGWKRILNALDAAERNIHSFAKAGNQHGAKGLINTDWGDHGHFNLLAGSWHGIALGAALGWSASHPTGRHFDSLYAHHVLGVNNIAIVESLRAASRSADTVETWKLLWMPNHDIPDADLPASDALAESACFAKQAACRLQQALSTTSPGNQTDLEELILACRFVGLLPRKLATRPAIISHELHNAGDWEMGDAAEELAGLANEFTRLWHVRNKRSGLDDILNALARIKSEMHQAVAS